MTNFKTNFNPIEELNNAFEHFKTENERKLKELEKKSSIDPLLEEKLNKIQDHLDNLEEIEIASHRPNSFSSNIKFSSQNEDLDYKYFLDYMIKGNSSDLENFRKNNIDLKSESYLATSNSGGFLISPQLHSKIIERITSQNVLRRFGNVINVNSTTNEYIQCLDEIENGGWVLETEDRETTRSPEISKITIKLNEVYTQPKISQNLLSDSIINTENWIVNKIADSFRILENKAFLFGDGVKKPVGLFSYNDHPDTKKKIEELLVPNAKTSPSASKNLTLDNLLNLMYMLDENYLENASWIMSPNALRVIRSLKDSTSGIYLWQPAFEKGSPSSLLGHPIGLSKELPIGDKVDDKPIAFGDFKQGFFILDSTKTIMIRDQYSYKPFILFYVSRRVGASVVNPHAIKIMKIIAPTS
jgi:HK97 family phage major capsid protein